MKNYLSTVDLAMWVAIIVGKLFLCLCILKKRFYGRLPWFSALIFAYSAKSFLLLALAYWARYATYYYTFYISGYIESALVLLTLIECGRQVLPGLNLPQKEKAFAGLGAALAAVLIFTVVWPLPSIAQERRIEVGAYLGLLLFSSLSLLTRATLDSIGHGCWQE